MNTKDGQSIPIDLGMALLSNPRAFINFAQLSAEQQRQFIDGTEKIETKKEMDDYVNRLIG